MRHCSGFPFPFPTVFYTNASSSLWIHSFLYSDARSLWVFFFSLQITLFFKLKLKPPFPVLSGFAERRATTWVVTYSQSGVQAFQSPTRRHKGISGGSDCRTCRGSLKGVSPHVLRRRRRGSLRGAGGQGSKEQQNVVWSKTSTLSSLVFCFVPPSGINAGLASGCQAFSFF